MVERGWGFQGEEEEAHYIFKLCLIGKGGVGKTCIARRLCFNSFDINTQLTIGIDFYTYNLPIVIEGSEGFLTLSIWDFGGQEQFKKLFSYYINGANGIFMVFSLVNLQTLIGLDWWYDQLVQFNHKNTPRILVGTKSDLIKESDEQNAVDELVVQQFMNKHNEDKYIQTSAKEDENIMSIFKEMARTILDKNNLDYDKIP